MYSVDIIKAIIKLYYKLKIVNIKGSKRKNIITSSFSIHINILYNWLKKYNCGKDIESCKTNHHFL